MFEYIKEYYKVPAEIGREILYKGDKNGEWKGIIVEDRGNYIGVNFYDSKPENIVSLHPTWKIEYLGIGKVRKVSKARMKAKQRYEEYRSADYFSGSFADWLGIKSKKTF